MNADPATDLNGLIRNNNSVVELLEKSKKIPVVETMVTTTPLMLDIAALGCITKEYLSGMSHTTSPMMDSMV